MSNKKQEIASAEVESTQQENNQVVTTSNAIVSEVETNNFEGLDLEALLEKSTQMDKLDTVLSLSPESITLEKVGESFRGIFMGFGEMTVNDPNNEEGKRVLQCAKFLISKKMCINGGAVLVSELHNANVKIGTPLEVTYTEKKGNVKIYRITLLG